MLGLHSRSLPPMMFFLPHHGYQSHSVPYLVVGHVEGCPPRRGTRPCIDPWARVMGGRSYI